MNKKNIIVFLFLTSFTSLFASDVTANELTPAEQYCKDQGGEVVSLVAQYETIYNTTEMGISKKFCKVPFNDGGTNHQFVDLSTFVTKKSTLAGTYLKTITANDVNRLDKGSYSSPAMNLCYNLHGTEIAMADIRSGGFQDYNTGQYGVCVFGDGSMISDWALEYTGIAPDKYSKKLQDSLRGQALNIPS